MHRVGDVYTVWCTGWNSCNRLVVQNFFIMDVINAWEMGRQLYAVHT